MLRATRAADPSRIWKVAFLVASAGPTTGFMEALASSIGAGLVVGGFLGGLVSFVLSRPRKESEKEALRGSYVGGVAGVVLLAIDILEKHFV